MRSIKLAVIGILLLLMHSCIEPFVPETAEYINALFIECLISEDQPEKTRLLITRAAPLRTEENENKTPVPELVSGAYARIIRDDGAETPFIEKFAGTYVFQEHFNPVPGNTYQLVVNFDNHEFRSDVQSILPSPPIDTLFARPDIEKTDETGTIYHGYRFYVSTHDPSDQVKYFRWSLDATFQYQVPYTATHVWDGYETRFGTNNAYMTCWKDKIIPGVYIASSNGLEENRIGEAPLNFEGQNGDELTIRYSLHVRQHAISESAYHFWSDLDKIVNQTGGLYETQPFRINGNIHCTTDPSYFVAGIFELSGVSESRCFVDRPTEFPVYAYKCRMDTVGTPNFPWYLLPAGSYVTHIISSDVWLTARAQCYDCRQRGGVNVAPAFWEFHE